MTMTGMRPGWWLTVSETLRSTCATSPGLTSLPPNLSSFRPLRWACGGACSGLRVPAVRSSASSPAAAVGFVMSAPRLLRLLRSVLHDGARDVGAGGLLEALEAGAGVDLDDLGAVPGLQVVDAGDLQAEGARRLQHVLALVFVQLERLARAAAVDVGAELADLGRAPPRADDLVAADEGAPVLALRLRDELLQHDDVVEAPERLQDGLQALPALRQHDADALRALQELEHARDAADLLDGLVQVVGAADDGGARQVDVGARQELEAQQLVAGAQDALARVDDGDPHDLELVDDGAAHLRHRRADAGHDDVDVGARHRVAGVPELRGLGVPHEVAARDVERVEAVAEGAAGLLEAPHRVEARLAGEEEEPHAASTPRRAKSRMRRRRAPNLRRTDVASPPRSNLRCSIGRGARGRGPARRQRRVRVPAKRGPRRR